MGPLLEIRSVPFQYEMVVNNARLELQSPQPGYELNRQEGGFQMKHTPSKIRINTVAARASMGLKSVGKAVDEFGQRGVNAAYQATAQMVKEGNMMMDTRNTNVFGTIGVQRNSNSIETMLGFIPSTPAQVSFDQYNLSMRYETDKLQFNWRTSNKARMDFVPASIEIRIKDYARLEIEYLGKPLYVPPSSSPDYVAPRGMDVRA